MEQNSNFSEVMEASDHFKNMASLRNLMSKFFLVLCLAMLFGCKQENTEKSIIWYECPIIIIDDSKVHLKWQPVPFYYHLISGYEYVEPDKVDIYISKNDMSNFQKLIELNYDKHGSYTVDNLQNNSPYFFFAVAKKKGLESWYSDTIMAIPNKRKEFEILQTSDEAKMSRISNFSISHQKNKMAYVDTYQYSILISNMDGSGKELVNVKSNSPSWSPTNDKIVYHSNGNHDVTWRHAQIVMYDYETKSITLLTDDDYYNYYPIFSKNGELLLFLLNKNTSSTYEANIYLMNLKTLESFQITDISKTSVRWVGGLSWIDNDQFLFHGNSEGKYRLFESSVSEKQITTIFESKWNDYSPSISPDQKKIAFISNRSGMSQVWIYHTDSKTFSQITGYSKSESTWSNIEWLDNSTIVFTINDIQLVKQRVE